MSVTNTADTSTDSVCPYNPFGKSSTSEKDTEMDYEHFYSNKCNRRTYSYLRRLHEKTQTGKGVLYRFATGNPNPHCFPYEKIHVTLKGGRTFEVKDKRLEDGLMYLGVKGYSPLLNLLKEFQDRIHGPQQWTHKDVCVTLGCNGAIFQLMETVLNEGDPILIESPVYSGTICILKALKPEIIEVEPDEHGISPKHLEALLQERKAKNLRMPKILYVNPTGTNPTGNIISTRRKTDIYKIASKYNFLILEDDPYYLVNFEQTNPTSFLSLDTEHRVIRLDSFSKTVGAGLRLGYVTAAKQIIEKLDLCKESTAGASPFCQVVLYETLFSMRFDGFMEHIRLVKKFYYQNRECILRAMEKHLKELAEWTAPKGAMFVWVKIKNTEHVSDEFIEKCLQRNVFLAPGSVFYSKPRPSPHIRFAFSTVTEDDIEEGIQIFAELLKREVLTEN